MYSPARILVAALLIAGLAGTAVAQDRQAIADKGMAYLKQTQSPDGSWSAKRAGPGITALVVAAMVKNGVSPDDPAVAKGLAYIESKV